MALINKLTAIGDAIRAKTGGSSPLSLDDMVTEIGSISGGGGIEFPTITLTSLANIDIGGQWDPVFEKFSDKLNTSGIAAMGSSFINSTLEDLSDFEINFTSSSGVIMTYTFQDCYNLKKLPKITTFPYKVAASNNLFERCYNLRTIPNDWANLDMSSDAQRGSMFADCYSLREIPQSWLITLYNSSTMLYSYNNYAARAYSLNELLNLNPINITYTKNVFGGIVHYDFRLKNFTFKTDNGTPYTRNWKKQVLDLSSCVGYYNLVSYEDYILNYNSGITADKKVTDATSYELLKNDPDWYTGDIAYSRYNHDSAVATINSLPDTSAVATGSNINTIKFKGDAGSATDGGAISTLTAAEIAVATAKGWTVALV